MNSAQLSVLINHGRRASVGVGRTTIVRSKRQVSASMCAPWRLPLEPREDEKGSWEWKACLLISYLFQSA